VTDQTESLGAATEPMPTVQQEVQDPLAQRKVPTPNITSLLANHLDWLQYDANQITQQIATFRTETATSLSTIQTHQRHISFALIVIAVGLVVNALLAVAIIYLLGTLIGRF
jgi:hypothetical protein